MTMTATHLEIGGLQMRCKSFEELDTILRWDLMANRAPGWHVLFQPIDWEKFIGAPRSLFHYNHAILPVQEITDGDKTIPVLSSFYNGLFYIGKISSFC